MISMSLGGPNDFATTGRSQSLLAYGGTADNVAMSARASGAIAALLWLTLALYTFGGLERPIGDGDEVFHAQVVAEMLSTGQYADARWQGVLVQHRPQTSYWLALPFAALLPGELGMRLSSALCSFATLLVVFFVARRTFERSDAAWLATLVLASSPCFHSYSRTLMSEPPYLLAIAVALGGALRALREPRGLLYAAAGLGAAGAIKSLAVAVPLLALLPWLAFAARAPLARRTALQAVAVFAALFLPYYAIELARHGASFWNEHVLFHLVRRAVGGYGLGLGASPLEYVLQTWKLEGPFVCAWLALGSAGTCVLGALRRQASLVLLGSFALGVLVLLSVMSTKLPHYLLPMHVAAALGVGGSYASLAQHASPRFNANGLAFVVLVGLIGGLWGLRYPGGEAWLLQRDQGSRLGPIARAVSAPGDVVYAYEWYGPSLGFYAQRRCVMLTAMPGRFASINFGTYERAGAARLTPPAPAPAGQTILIAGPADELKRAAWLEVRAVLGFAAPYFLVRGQIRSDPPRASALSPSGPGQL